MDDLAAVTAAIGDPLRVRILDILSSGRDEPCCSPENPELPNAVCACDIGPALGGLSPSKLAYHLGRLRSVGLLREQRRGKWVYYAADRERLAEVARALAERWCGPSSSPPTGSPLR